MQRNYLKFVTGKTLQKIEFEIYKNQIEFQIFSVRINFCTDIG
jgi:hypothetical protein